MWGRGWRRRYWGPRPFRPYRPWRPFRPWRPYRPWRPMGFGLGCALPFLFMLAILVMMLLSRPHFRRF